jgi:hypothetical protein
MTTHRFQYDHRVDHMGSVTLTRFADGTTVFLQGEDADAYLGRIVTFNYGEIKAGIYDSIIAEYFTDKPLVAEHPVRLHSFWASEAAGYAEEFGPLAEALDKAEGVEATISGELMAAIKRAQEYLAANPTAKVVHLGDSGLNADWEGILGEFSADCESLRVWSHGSVDWYAEHKHNCEAQISFDIKLL